MYEINHVEEFSLTALTFKCCLFQVNSAGIVEVGGIESTSLEQYDHVMNVNTRYCKITKDLDT